MKKKPTLLQTFTLHSVADEGNLLIGELKKNLPFAIKRFYIIRKIDNGAVRGMHAHRKNKQILFCLQGAVTIIVDDGTRREQTRLTDPKVGVLFDTWIWHEMVDFTPDAVLLVIASEYFEEKDYIRSYDQFVAQRRKRSVAFPVLRLPQMSTLTEKLKDTKHMLAPLFVKGNKAYDSHE